MSIKLRPGWYAMTPWLRLPVAYLVGMTIYVWRLVLVVYVQMARDLAGLPKDSLHPLAGEIGALFVMGAAVATLSGGKGLVHARVVAGLVAAACMALSWMSAWPVVLGIIVGILPAVVAFGGAALGGWIARGLGSDRPLTQPSSEPEAQG